MIEIELETPQLSLQVNGVPIENLVKKFAPQGSDQPLYEGMRNWRVRNRFELVYRVRPVNPTYRDRERVASVHY